MIKRQAHAECPDPKPRSQAARKKWVVVKFKPDVVLQSLQIINALSMI